MKKFLAFTLAIMMIATMSVTAFAADTDTKTTDTNITTSVAPTYTVTIPANTTVTFNATETSFGSIEVDAAQIHPDKCIKVALTYDGKLENSIDNSKVIPYVINAGDAEFTSATYLAAGDKTDLTINITQDDWNKAYAGDYSDTVTFTVSYETIETDEPIEKAPVAN